MTLNMSTEELYLKIDKCIIDYIHSYNTKTFDIALPLKTILMGLYSKYYDDINTLDLVIVLKNRGKLFKGCSSFYGIGLLMLILNLYEYKIDRKSFKYLNSYFSRFLESYIKDYKYQGTIKELELINGLSGIGLCILSYCHKEDFFKKAINKILNIIINKYSSSNYSDWCSNYKEMTEYEKSYFPDGCVNLGMAHSLSGLIVFLSQAYVNGFESDELKKTIIKLTDFILSRQLCYNQKPLFPARISRNNLDNNKDVNNQYPLSWCHGLSGICNSILLAGNSLNVEEYTREAIQIYKQYLMNSDLNEHFLSMTVCHGYAGILPSLKNFYNYTGDKFFLEYMNVILEKILYYYETHKVFFDYNYDKGNNLINENLDHVSLLTSSESVIITLISLLNDDSHYFKLLGVF